MRKDKMPNSIRRNGQREAGMPCRTTTKKNSASDAGITDEQLREVLHHLQRMRKIVKEDIKVFLVTEDWDWLVIMECLQDHGMFKSCPERMPFTDFETWMQQMPQYLSECHARNMGRVYNKLSGARYPWKGVEWYPCVLRRWRALYQILDKMLSELEDSMR